MSGLLILLVMVIYLITGLDFCIKGQIGLGITFLAYSVSNLGLYLASRNI